MENQNSYIFNFSKFLFKVILIIGISGYLFGYVFEKTVIFKSEINRAAKVNRIINENDLNETPIFGSSRAEGSYVPSLITSGEYFNYGMADTQANIWLFFLEEELKKNKKTDIIINLDLWGIVYSDGNIGNYIPNYSITKKILKQEGEFYYNIPFVKYFGQFERYFKFYLNEKWNLTKITDFGGSFEKNKLSDKKFQELVQKRKETPTVFSLEPDLSKKLNRLLESTDRKIFFVVAPCHESVFENFETIDESNKFLFNLNKRNNVSVIDLRNLIQEDFLFLNTTHVNYDGAVVFSKKLNDLLKDD
ncbi:unnamed protein product, partial [Ectocarpus fasciculatus]